MEMGGEDAHTGSKNEAKINEQGASQSRETTTSQERQGKRTPTLRVERVNTFPGVV